MIPRLMDRERRASLAALIGLGLVEALCLALAALSLGRAIDAMTAQSLSAAVGFGFAAALVSWGRQVAAEDFGARYAAALRRFLARQAIAAAGEGRPGRLGVMAVRMTGDLTALRDWASLGLTDAVSASALSLAGVLILALTLSLGGLWVAGAALFPALLAAALLAVPLAREHEQLRRQRGRVAGQSGDIVQSTNTLWALNAARRETARLDRRSEDLRRVSVRRRILAAGVAVQAIPAAGLGGATAALLAKNGAFPALSAGEWAPVMLALGFLATASAGLARALDSACAYRAGFDRFSELVDAPAAAALQEQTMASIPDPQRGSIVWIESPTAAEAAARIEAAWRAGAQSENRRLKGQFASPAMPLIRASLRRNLSLGRPVVGDNVLQNALLEAGLDPAAWPMDTFIDPLNPRLDAWTQARLRLARALAHAGKTLYLAEPLLAANPGYQCFVERLAAHSSLAIVALRLADTPSKPIGEASRASYLEEKSEGVGDVRNGQRTPASGGSVRPRWSAE